MVLHIAVTWCLWTVTLHHHSNENGCFNNYMMEQTTTKMMTLNIGAEAVTAEFCTRLRTV